MKKFLVALSLVCFVFVTVSKAQTASASTKQEAKTEASSVKAADTKAPATGCCHMGNSACCKNNKDAKACTPEQKAACAKAGEKAEAAPAKTTKGSN
jgi:hypothetical protein